MCVAMDIDTGELLVIYEWSLQCRTVKKGDTRRLKQVTSLFKIVQVHVHHVNVTSVIPVRVHVVLQQLSHN